MDCDKFEATLIDELYGELDELTSAAAKRHVAGCARCAGRLNGLRATRRLAVLPMVEPPGDLEDRILAAAKDAQKVVSIDRRVSRAVAWATSWAVRPQTAMAAVFLLMIAGSVVFLRGRASAPATATVAVKAEGEPADVPAAPAASAAPVDLAAAATAHGAATPPPQPAPVPAETATAAADDEAQSEVAMAKEAPYGAQAPAARRSAMGAYGGSGGGSMNASSVAGAPAASAAYAANDVAKKDKGGGEGRGPAFDSAMAQYRAGAFGDATRAWDGLAAGGDSGSALWAARAVRDGNGGCAQAVPRFDKIAGTSFGTNIGYDATLEAGRCLTSMGATDAARSRFARLLGVPDYASRAQAEIDALSQGQVATRAERVEQKARPMTKTNKATPPAAAAPPPARPAKPPAQTSGF